MIKQRHQPRHFVRVHLEQRRVALDSELERLKLLIGPIPLQEKAAIERQLAHDRRLIGLELAHDAVRADLKEAKGGGDGGGLAGDSVEAGAGVRNELVGGHVRLEFDCLVRSVGKVNARPLYGKVSVKWERETENVSKKCTKHKPYQT
mgnify:CR=1 FL=1